MNPRPIASAVSRLLRPRPAKAVLVAAVAATAVFVPALASAQSLPESPGGSVSSGNVAPYVVAQAGAARKVKEAATRFEILRNSYRANYGTANVRVRTPAGNAAVIVLPPDAGPRIEIEGRVQDGLTVRLADGTTISADGGQWVLTPGGPGRYMLDPYTTPSTSSSQEYNPTIRFGNGPNSTDTTETTFLNYSAPTR